MKTEEIVSHSYGAATFPGGVSPIAHLTVRQGELEKPKPSRFRIEVTGLQQGKWRQRESHDSNVSIFAFLSESNDLLK